jgi:putative transposase
MALSQFALRELVEVLKDGHGSDPMLRLLTAMLQLVDAEASAFIGALPHERGEARATRRNGSHEKIVTTGVGA